MRSILFAIAYYAISITHVLSAAVAALRPGRGAVRRVISRFGRRMVWAMDVFAGIKLEVRGRENLPQGAFIIAPKHQSWGDGFCSFSQFDDVAFVTGDHLERFPLFKPILRKLGAIVVDNCGGPEARNALQAAASQAHKEGRKILIYPEGHLAPVGVRYRYRSGVYYMSRDFEMQVVPVATNLGCFWPQQSFWKKPGTAVIEFLPPIPTGLKRTEFLTRLEKAVEDRTAELVAEATGKPVTPSVLEVPDAEKERAEARAKEAEPAGMIANAVTASRLVLAVPLYLLLTASGDGAAWAAFGVLVLAGLTDVVDGRIARALNQVSKLGAMPDLISDRVLTATLAVGLIAGGRLTGLWAAAALVLLARDLAVASFGEATEGRAKFPVTPLERVKIALQFAGFGLLVAPEIVARQHLLGAWALAASAALAIITLAGYARRAAGAFKNH